MLAIIFSSPAAWNFYRRVNSFATNFVSWLVFQLGAREHYAIPRALNQQGLLQSLITDSWVPPGSLLARLVPSKSLVGRFHSSLHGAEVVAPSLASLPFELRSRVFGLDPGWPRTMERNGWFQRWACRRLACLTDPPEALFAYSYAARLLFELARERGYPCVLGQIDPGPEEEQLVVAEHRRYPHLASSWKPAPDLYWQHWQKELELADCIVVNSGWSFDCLSRQGVPQQKLRVIPLVYELSQSSHLSQDAVSPSFSKTFNLLFLGTICLRKGIGRLLEAMRLLERQPVQLTLAGPSELDSQAWANANNVRWLGPVPRSEVGFLYRQAQAMILPTLSDGFAITQLEALAHGCPVIASQHCGEVVTQGVNGWLMPSLEPEEIASTIVEAMDSAATLSRPLARPGFGLDQLATALLSTATII